MTVSISDLALGGGRGISCLVFLQLGRKAKIVRSNKVLRLISIGTTKVSGRLATIS